LMKVVLLNCLANQLILKENFQTFAWYLVVREKMKEKANQIREEVIRIGVKGGAGHIAPSLSCVDILTALYYSAMTYKPEEPLWEDRDRLVFSKAHGCYALYAILADRGVIPKEEWENF